MRLSRRSVLLGGAGGIAAAGTAGTLVEYDVLPGRSRAHRLLGMTGGSGVIPAVVPGRRAEGELSSALVTPDPHFVVSYPPGSAPGDALPVVVALHGAGRTAEAWFDELGVDEFLAGSGHRFAIAAVDGGLRSFWHERINGDDPARMVLEEFVPALASRGLALAGLLGWSMGGLGALMLGARLDAAARGVPVVAVSPALWPEYGQAMAGAFDTEQQYDEAMTLARDRLAEPRVRIDCGTADPFYRDVRAVVPDGVEQHYERGAHEAEYWTRELPGQLDWLAERL